MGQGDGRARGELMECHCYAEEFPIMPRRIPRRAVLAVLAGLPLAALPALAAEREKKPRHPAKGADDRGWKPLFDGRSLAGWKRTGFAGGGEVRVEPRFRDGGPAVVVEAGADLSGFHWTGKPPRTDYEIALEVLKIEGSDFMLGLTFPVADSHATLVLGGWGGPVVGISSIDHSDASENPTTRYMSFVTERWYRVRLRVTPARLETWLDDEKIVDQEIEGRKISLRPGSIHLSTPLGITTYQTSAAYRNIRLRRLKR
jgi:hypothetical protein